MEIRPIEPDELEAFAAVVLGAFGEDLPHDPDKRARMLERMRVMTEFPRSRCAFDGGRLIGTLGVFSLDLTVPGGSVPCAGTTMVSVQPTHRRQGVMRQMIAAHLQEATEHGDPVAGLWASDSAIYGRFGFGTATRQAKIDIDTHHARLHRLAPQPGRIEAITTDEAEVVLPEVYAGLHAEIPGFFARTPDWWKHRRLRDEPDDRDGASAFRYAIARGPKGTPDGYVQYRTHGEWRDDHGAFELRVNDLVAFSPSSWAALWSFLFNHDLTRRVVARNRALDDPVFDLLAGPRRASSHTIEGLWIRILDVSAALTRRRYRIEGTVVFEVHDAMGLTSGRWRLETDGTESSCTGTDDQPDIVLDIEDLSSAFLGAARFSALARGGRLTGTPPALTKADLMFGWHRAPWCPEVF